MWLPGEGLMLQSAFLPKIVHRTLREVLPPYGKLDTMCQLYTPPEFLQDFYIDCSSPSMCIPHASDMPWIREGLELVDLRGSDLCSLGPCAVDEHDTQTTWDRSSGLHLGRLLNLPVD